MMEEPCIIELNMHDPFRHIIELRMKDRRLVGSLNCNPSESVNLLNSSVIKLFKEPIIEHAFIEHAFNLFSPRRITVNERKNDMVMRDYQIDLEEAIEGHLMFDDKAVVALPQGGGKSIVIANTAKNYSSLGETVVIMTNFSELIPQLAKHLDAFNIEYNIVKAGSNKYSESAKVWLIMEQSFHEDKRTELNIECSILIKDEFHVGAGQKRYEDIVAHLKPDKILGFTATPYDEKGYVMHDISTDQIITSCTARELMAKGYLTNLRYFTTAWSESVDYADVSSTGSDYNGKELDEIVNTDEHTKLVIGSMDQMNAKDRKTLVYASSIEHADTINRALLKSGYSSAVVHSKMSSDENHVAIAKFKDEYINDNTLIETIEEPINCLVSCMTLTTGFDAPKADLLVLLRPTKVWRLYSQIALRVGRTFKDKLYGDILDLAQCLKEHGFAEDPLPYIMKGEKQLLARAKGERSIDYTKPMAKEEPTEISIETIKQYVKEFKQKEAAIETMPMVELLSLWDVSSNYDTVIHIGYEMAKRMNGSDYKERDLLWARETWSSMFDDFYEYRYRLIKTLKTRIKNIVRDKKKISSIRYFPDFLKQNSPYNGEFNFSTFKM